MNPFRTTAVSVALFVAALVPSGCGDESPERITLPAGTEMAVALVQPVTTEYHRAGDPIEASVTSPLVVDGRTVVRVGTTLRGRVTATRSAGPDGGAAALTLAFGDVVDDFGTTQRLAMRPVIVAPPSSDAEEIRLNAGDPLQLVLEEPAHLALAGPQFGGVDARAGAGRP